MGELRRFAQALKRNAPVSGEHLYLLAIEIDKQLAAIKSTSVKRAPGIGGYVDDPIKVPQTSLHTISAAVPSPAGFSVLGLDGKFIITIANPQSVIPQSVGIMQARVLQNMNPNKAAIVHNVQSSSDLTFSNASSITDYGISSALAYTLQLPNQTLFWRIRSSYDGQTWNQWQIFSSAQTCGPVGVQSGAMRTVALFPNTQYNETNFATVDSIDGGASATIRVYGPGGIGSSWKRQAGSVQVGSDNTQNTTIPGASLLGYAYTTTFDVFFDIATQQYFVINPTTNYPATLVDTYAFAGQVTTVAAGGGGGTSGGGGGGGTSGGNGGQKR